MTDITEIAIKIPNWWVARAGDKTEEVPLALAQVRASLETVLDTASRFDFDPNITGVVQPGRDLLSDFKRTTIAKGAEFYTRHWINATDFALFANNIAQLGQEGINAGTTTRADNTVVNPASWSLQAFGCWPLALIGRTSERSALLIGDSIMEGVGDTKAGVDFIGIGERTVGPIMGYINAGQSGDRLEVFRTSYNRRVANVQYNTDVVSNFGNNDIGNGRTAAAIMADLIWSWTLFKAKGALRVWQTNYVPRTNESNVPVAGFGPGSVQAALNAWLADGAPISDGAAVAVGGAGLRAGAAGHPLTGVIDVASVFQTGDSGVWSNLAYQSDYIHPSQAGYQAVAASSAYNAFKAAA